MRHATDVTLVRRLTVEYNGTPGQAGIEIRDRTMPGTTAFSEDRGSYVIVIKVVRQMALAKLECEGSNKMSRDHRWKMEGSRWTGMEKTAVCE